MDEDGNDATVERYFFSLRDDDSLFQTETIRRHDRESWPTRGKERGEKSCFLFFLFKVVRHQHVLAWVMNSKARSAECFSRVSRKLEKVTREFSAARISLFASGNKLLVTGNQSGSKNRRDRMRRCVFSRVNRFAPLSGSRSRARSIDVVSGSKIPGSLNQWILLRRCRRRSLSNFDARRPVKRPHCGYMGFSTAFSPSGTHWSRTPRKKWTL